MKVVIIGPAHPYRGGIADTNHSLANAFIKEGHDAELVTFTLQYPKVFFPGKNQYTDAKKPDLTITRKVNSINPFSWLTAASFINKKQPDLVVFRYWIPYLAPALGSVARLVKCQNVVAMCDNVIPHEPTRFDRVLSKYFLNSVNEFVTLSSHVAGELAGFGKSNIKSLFHPINSDLGEPVSRSVAREKLGLEKEGKYILFFGLIRAYKGLDLLIEALAKAQDQSIKLVIAGEFYEDEKKYLDLISKNQLESRVNVVNQFIPSEEIPLYFSAADVLGLTYKSASQSGITQMAYHFQVPVLATNVGGLSEMIEHKKIGYLADKNAEQIAKGIDYLFGSNELTQFKDNLKAEKENYSWSSFVKQLV